MDQKRWILSILIVVATVLITDYLFWHYIFSPKRAALEFNLEDRLEEELQDEAPLRPRELPRNEQLPTSPDSGSLDLNQRIERCEEFRQQSLNDLLEALKTRGVAHSSTALENWRVLRPDGREQRIMVIPAEGENTKETKEVRLFDVDHEDLPVPIPLRRDLAFDPSANYLESLKSPGEILSHQKQEEMTFLDGSQALVKWMNNEVQELQVRMKTRSLACQNQTCQCL